MHSVVYLQRLAGKLFITAFAALLLSNALSFAAYPSFNPALRYFSDFGAIPATSFIWNTGMLAFGLLIIAGSLLLISSPKDKLSITAGIAAGLGFIMVALFPETIASGMHALGALIGFAAGGIFTIASRNMAKWKIPHIAIFLGAVSLASTFLILSSSGSFLPGTLEMLIVGPFAIWLLILGISCASIRQVFHKTEERSMVI